MSKIKIKKKINKYPNGGNLKNAYSITADALSLFPPTSGLGYVMGLPTTAYDMYEDYQKGDIKQMGLDAMGLIPAFKLMKYSKFAKSATQGINMASKFNKAVDVANMANDVNQTIEKKELGGKSTYKKTMGDGGRQPIVGTPQQYQAYQDSVLTFNNVQRFNKNIKEYYDKNIGNKAIDYHDKLASSINPFNKTPIVPIDEARSMVDKFRQQDYQTKSSVENSPYKADFEYKDKYIHTPPRFFGGNIITENEWELVNEDLPKAGNGLSLVKTLTPIGNRVKTNKPSLYKNVVKNVDKIEHNINDKYRVQADDFTDKFYSVDYDEDSGHNDYVDALRHSATAMYTTSGQGEFLSPLKIPYTNVMGLAHELKGLVNYVNEPGNLTWQGAKQQLKETGSDLYNNFVGSVIGGLPTNIENKEKILKFAKDKNILSDLSKKQNGGKLPKRKLNLKKSNSDWEIIG